MGSASPGSGKERCLEPQITIGLLTDDAGVPLMVEAFEGNAAETTTMLPTITAFMAAHLGDVTIVADAGMISAANKRAIKAAGLSFILGTKIPDIPYVVGQWRREHEGEPPPDGLILTQPRPRALRSAPRRGHLLPVPGRPGPAHAPRDRRAGRQGRARGGREGTGQTQPLHPPRRCGQVRQPGARGEGAGVGRWKGYTTNLATCPEGTPVTAEFVTSAYHRLFQIEASFRMSKHDLAARPIYHHKRETIDAHLKCVFAALAVGRLVEQRTGWSIRRFVRTARRYRTVQIRAGTHLLTAEDPLPDDLREALALINTAESAH
jgi:hypothetical protein